MTRPLPSPVRLPYCPCGECPNDEALWTPECREEARALEVDSCEICGKSGAYCAFEVGCSCWYGKPCDPAR